MAALTRATDWSQTPLGPVDSWPASLRAVVELCLNAPFPMCVSWGPDFTQIYNDGFAPLLGVKHPGIFARGARESWQEVWDMLERQFRSVVTTGEALFFEDQLFPLVRREVLEECYFTFSYSPLYDEQQTAQGVLAVAHETTRVIIAARRQHLLSTLRHQIGAAASIDEVWTRMQAAFDAANPDTSRAALYTPGSDGTVAGLAWIIGDASQPPAWPPPADAIARVLAARAGAGSSGASGAVQPFEGTRGRLVLLRNMVGDPAAVLAVDPGSLVYAGDDYDELLRQIGLTVEEQTHHLEHLIGHVSAVQAELSDAEVRYQSLFESTRDGVLFSAPDGSVYGANPAACAMLGYSEAEMRTQRRDDLFFPGDEELPDAVRIRRETGQFSGELTFRRRDGAALRVDLSSTIFVDTAGRERVVTIFRDVTERRRLEAQAQEMRRMDTLGQLTGGVAHDFNNLLTVILGATNAIEGAEPETDVAGLARTIRQAAGQAAGLTKQLLAFARRQPLHPLPTDLNALVAQNEVLLRRALGEGVTLILEPGALAWPALADPSQLEVAVLNLAINSRDAMPDGGTLTIGTANRTVTEADAPAGLAPGDYVELFVRDTGLGMPAEVASHAVEPFFTTKEPGRGTGLGLSMAYGVVRQLGGTLTIDTAPGEGTTVRLLLPRARGSPGRVAASDGTLPRARPGEVVLAVEDNDLVRGLARRLLERLGYEVIVAAGAAEALEALTGERRIDLLFTDVVMPGGIDGRQLARRARDCRPTIAVLLTSGYMHPHAVVPLEDGDPHERLLSKPYELAPLAHAVRAAIDARS
jgi:PAS domain S-box-containing protein